MPPSDQPYNFSVPEEEVSTFGQYGQPWYIDSVIFKEKVLNGFFIGKYSIGNTNQLVDIETDIIISQTSNNLTPI